MFQVSSFMFQTIRKYRYSLILSLIILIYVGYFSVFTILRHQKLQSNYYDLGIMDQTVYNTYRGRILQLTNPEGSNTINRLAIHNDALLALLAPFYVIYSGPETLLVIQTVVLALGAIPLYLLASKILKSKYLALVFAFAYLMYPPLQRANIYDFHAVTLATTLLLFMFYLWTEKKYLASFIFFILAILSKEQVALTTGMFGLFILLPVLVKGRTLDKYGSDPVRKELVFGSLLCVFSVIWFIASIWFIIPHFTMGEHFAIGRYKEFGSSSSSVITGFVTHPIITMARLFSINSLNYLFLLTVPIFFLSFFSPLYILIALPEFLINLLSNEPNMQNIIHQYTAVITPFIFIAAIYGTASIRKKFKIISTLTIGIIIVVSTLVMSYIKGPLPYSLEKNMAPFTDNPAVIYDITMWKKILTDESIKIAATDSFAAQFAERKTIMRFSESYPEADYVVLNRDQVFNDWLDWYNMPNIYTKLKNDKLFTMIYKHNDFEVYKKL